MPSRRARSRQTAVGETTRKSAAGITWQVLLPSRKASLGAAKPKATLVIDPGGPAEERVAVPVAVGRALERKLGDSASVGSRAELIYRMQEIERACMRDRAERMVSQREYSSKELVDRLRMDGYPEGMAQELVDRYVASGAVDDERFARVFASSKASAGWGLRRIERELSRRGVDVEALPGWPEEVVGEDEETRAYEIASRRSLLKRSNLASTVRFLASKGFPEGLAYGVARRVVAEAQEELESD